MSKFLSLSLCLLVAVTIAVTADAQDHKIPAIPDEFSCTIEANIANNGYTFDIREYYDVQNNRIRMERHSRGSSMINIFDFNNVSLFFNVFFNILVFVFSFFLFFSLLAMTNGKWKLPSFCVFHYVCH